MVIFILLMLACAYMCIAIVFAPALISFKVARSDWLLFCYHVCPWLLLYLSAKGWYRVRTWRRMLARRYPAPSLSRGLHRFNHSAEKPHLLEHVALFFLTLALYTLKEVWL